MEKIYEGKAKILYSAENDENIIQYFKDDTTAFNNKKFAISQNKGVLNNIASAFFMGLLENNGVKTHFIKKIDDRNQLVKKVNIIPLEVIVRNVAAGSFSKKFGVARGTVLPQPLVEFSLKDDNLGDPLIPDDHIVVMNIATYSEIDYIKKQARKVNEILQKVFMNAGITLVDFKIEFGKDPQGNIILADEISPDSCRLWDIKTNESLDKDLFREDKGNIIDGYMQVLQRLGII
jgi:phosphoribosylaminoimidazole-succinocarboxamide synthase